MYTCDDSCADGFIENDIFNEIDSCDEIDSLSPNSSDSPSFVTHTLDPILELKPLPDSLKYVFLDPNKTFLVIIASDLTEDQ